MTQSNDMNNSFSAIRKQVLGNTNSFQLIDTELCESKLYFASAKFSAISGDHLARALFLNNLLLFILSQEPEHQQFAQKYALKTIQYGRYAVFRTHATDLYVLSYAVLHPDSEQIALRDGRQGVRYLQTLDLDQQMSIEFIRRIAAGTHTSSQATRYLYRLETQLRVRDGRYRLWRREAALWDQVRPAVKAQIIKMMLAEVTRLGGGTVRNSELVTVGLRKLAKKYINTPEPVAETLEPVLVPRTQTLGDLHQRWSGS